MNMHSVWLDTLVFATQVGTIPPACHTMKYECPLRHFGGTWTHRRPIIGGSRETRATQKSFPEKKMRETGIEPAHLSVLDPKSSASANSATLANRYAIRLCRSFLLLSLASFFACASPARTACAIGMVWAPSATMRRSPFRRAIAM